MHGSYTIPRFDAIEGFRAWLAWAVVLDHAAHWAGLRGLLGEVLRHFGWNAVTCFMIVSGFVITHLLLERPESYRYYLLRRFFRLFPLFAVVCLFGYYSYQSQSAVIGHGFDPAYGAYLQTIIDATEQHFWAHVLAHLTMLHGAVSYSILPQSDVAFVMFGWSVSLEWQFYLVAPFVVAALVRWPGRGAVAMVLAFLALQLVAQHRMTGLQPAFLLNSAMYFALGIGSRMLWPLLAGKIKNQYAALAGVFVLYAVTKQHALAAWGIVYLGLLLDTPPRLYRLALQSPVARYLGSRSYSVFLGHFLVINGSVWLWHEWTGQAPGVVPLLTMTIPITLWLSEILYHSVELPGIALGAYWCKKLKARGLPAGPLKHKEAT